MRHSAVLAMGSLITLCALTACGKSNGTATYGNSADSPTSFPAPTQDYIRSLRGDGNCLSLQKMNVEFASKNSRSSIMDVEIQDLGKPLTLKFKYKAVVDSLTSHDSKPSAEEEANSSTTTEVVQTGCTSFQRTSSYIDKEGKKISDTFTLKIVESTPTKLVFEKTLMADLLKDKDLHGSTMFSTPGLYTQFSVELISNGVVKMISTFPISSLTNCKTDTYLERNVTETSIIDFNASPKTVEPSQRLKELQGLAKFYQDTANAEAVKQDEINYCQQIGNI